MTSRSADEFLPEGSLVTARIEIVSAITPEGKTEMAWYAATAEDEELTRLQAIGLLELAKIDFCQESGHE